ncbi:unnamed protein product [Symbiodinium sp. CCMP2592]|nr:unnamed protein product [Symbiodinium sp. CCMP2592]
MTRGDRGGVQGARSGGMTHHIQGPHLVPNVGREAMLVAEVIRRRPPKAKAKSSKPQAPLVPSVPSSERRGEKAQAKPREKRKRKDSERARSSSVPPRKSRSRTQVRPEHDSPDADGEEDEAAEEDAIEGALPALDVNSEHEARRIEEERRQLQRLKEVQEKKRKQESERRRNLGGVFALSADDFDKEEDERAKRAQAAQEEARSEKQQLRHPTSRTSASQRRDEKMVLDDGSPGSGFDKCWKNWDFTKAEDPAEVARQFMRVTAAKRRGYGGAARDARDGGTRNERPERERRRSRSGSRGRSRSRR